MFGFEIFSIIFRKIFEDSTLQFYPTRTLNSQAMKAKTKPVHLACKLLRHTILYLFYYAKTEK